MRGIPNPQLNAIALLVRRFGERIAGGGFEVRVTALDLTGLPPKGVFREVPDIDGRGVRWQYFPNDDSDVIDLKPGDWKESAPEASLAVREVPCGHRSINPHSTRTCNFPAGHGGKHGDHDGYDLLESWDADLQA